MINNLKKIFTPIVIDRNYFPHIDGLRAIAVLIVVLFHAFPHSLKGGFIGVDVFFVISGYLISGILFKDIINGEYSIKTFYERRINRIFPALIFVILVCIAASYFLMFKDERVDFFKSILFASTFLANLFFYQKIDYFAGSAEDYPLLHLWSLGVEEQFYILWPLLLVYLTFNVQRRVTSFIFLIIAISFSYNLYLTYHYPSAAFYLPFGRFWELAAGAMLAALEIWHSKKLTPFKKYSNIWVLIGLIFIAVGIFQIDSSMSFPGFYAITPVLATSLILLFGAKSWLGVHLLSNPILVFFGTISYPLYLWHWPILSFLHVQEGVAPKVAKAAAVILSIVLAALTYFFIEKPIRFKVKSSFKPLFLLLVLVAICLIVWLNIVGLQKIPVTSKDLFISYYKNYVVHSDYIKKNRVDCGYINTNGTLRDYIPEDCYKKNNERVVMLWGDSHAYQFYYGLKQSLPKDYDLLQIASSGCAPAIPERSTASKECKTANSKALNIIQKTSPEVLILAQRMSHEHVDWEKIAEVLKTEYGVKHVILIGPVPQWNQYLYRHYARKHSEEKLNSIEADEYQSSNLNQDIIEVDNLLTGKYKGSQLIEYLSPIHLLCTSAKSCLITLSADNKTELTTFDYGHITLPTSEFIATQLIKPKLK